MRILLKISGESFKSEKDLLIDPNSVKNITKLIKNIYTKNIQLIIVIGGGNIYRGKNLIKNGVNSTDSHNLSMLSTVFNGVVLKNFLKLDGLDSKVMDPNGIKFIEKYNKDKAIEYIENGKILICTGGTGSPYFTTDTGGVLRALELNCNLMIKATKVDGIYDKDPMKYDDANFLEKITYDDFISKKLQIMDQTAIIMAKDNNLVIKVVNFSKNNILKDIIDGKNVGSTIN